VRSWSKCLSASIILGNLKSAQLSTISAHRIAKSVTSFAYFEGPQEDVVLHVLPSGMEDFKNYRFHSSQVVEAHPAGGAVVRFRASGMLELAWHLFCWGNKIEIVEPVSLREQLTTELRVALAHHEEPLRFNAS